MADTDRVLASVLFMDVVGSTERASELGDQSWRLALDLFERKVREGLALYAGQLTSTAGDGMLATFDGPGTGDPVRSAHPRRAARGAGSRSAPACTRER